MRLLNFNFLRRNKPLTDKVIASRIRELLEFEINGKLAAHGGNVELERVTERRAYLKFGGGCQGCAASALTMKLGVEQRIKELIPEVEETIDVTDHTAGENPYYNEAPA